MGLAAVAIAAHAISTDVVFVEDVHRAGTDDAWTDFNFSVCLLGASGQAQVVLHPLDVPPGWDTYLMVRTSTNGPVYSSADAFFTLFADEAASGVLRVLPDGTVPSGTHTISLRSYIWQDEANATLHQVYVEVPPFVNLSVDRSSRPTFSPSPPDFTIFPGEATLIRVLVTNLGPTDDSFRVWAAVTRDIPYWDAEITSGLDVEGRTPTLSRGSSYWLSVTAIAPAFALVGDWNTVTIEARSSSYPEHVDPAVTARFDLWDIPFNVSIVGDRVVPVVYLGGRPADLNVSLLVKSRSMDGLMVNVGLDAETLSSHDARLSAMPSIIPMEPFGLEELVLNVVLPTSVPPGNYTVNVTFSTYHGNDPFEWWAQVHLLVKERHYVTLSKSIAGFEIRPGDAVSCIITARNDGNSHEAFNVTYRKNNPGWAMLVQPPSMALSPGEVGMIFVGIASPQAGDEAIASTYHFIVSVDVNPNGGFPYATCVIPVSIPQTFRIEWAFLDQSITTPLNTTARLDLGSRRPIINPYGSGYADLSLDLKNLGNGDDNVQVWAETGTDGLYPSASPMGTFLKYNTTKVIRLRIEASKDLSPGVYPLSLLAESQDRSLAARTVLLECEVINLDACLSSPPRIVDGTVKRGDGNDLVIEQGTVLSFGLDVMNAGSSVLPSILVIASDHYQLGGHDLNLTFFLLEIPEIPIGGSIIVGDDASRNPEYVLRWSANLSGGHVLEFRVLHESQSNNSNDVTVLNVWVERAAKGEAYDETRGIFIVMALAIVSIAAIIAVLPRIRASDVEQMSPCGEDTCDQSRSPLCNGRPPSKPSEDDGPGG